MDDYLRAAPVDCDGAADFHLLPSQRFQIAKLVSVGSEDDGAERAMAIIGAKVQKSVSGTRSHHTHHAPRHTALLAHVLPCVANIHAGCVRGALPGATSSPAPEAGEERQPEHKYQKNDCRDPFVRYFHAKLANRVTVRKHLRRSLPSGARACRPAPRQYSRAKSRWRRARPPDQSRSTDGRCGPSTLKSSGGGTNICPQISSWENLQSEMANFHPLP